MRDIRELAAAVDLGLAVAILALTVDVIRGSSRPRHVRSWTFFAIASMTLVIHSALATVGNPLALDGAALFEVVTVGFLAIGFAFLYGADREGLRRLQDEAERDPLTDLYNLRAFRSLAAGRLRRVGSAIAVLDLDGFKAVNDTHGHATGDHVLQLVAAAIRANLRDADLAARYGGDEFVLLVNGGGSTAAERIAQRIQSSLGALSRSTTETVTLSGGVAEASDRRRDLATLLAAADAALLDVKRTGKRRIAVAS